MGVKVKGECFCPACDKPVAAQKATHRFRNTTATLTLGATTGMSALAFTNGKWHCPNCGGPVRDLADERRRERNAGLTTWIKTHPKICTAIAFGTLLLATIADL